MALKNERYFDTIPSSYKVIGAAPIDLRQVVQNLDNLYGEIAEQTHTWDVDGDIVAYDGMLVGVLEERKIYMCIDYLHPYVASSWKILNPDLDISGEMINVIYFNGDATHEAGYYNEADGSGEPWEPNEDAEPIKDQHVNEPGKYLCIILNEDQSPIYINSKDLISLDNYYTKQEINDFLGDISTYINDINASINIINDFINSSIGNINYEEFPTVKDYIDASIDNIINDYITDLSNNIIDLSTSISEINFEINNISSNINDISTRLISNITTNTDYVHTDVSNNIGHINLDLIDASKPIFQNIENNGITTKGYVEERLDVFNWLELDDFEEYDKNKFETLGILNASNSINVNIPEIIQTPSLEIISENGEIILN